VPELERSFTDLFQNWLHAIDGVGARIEERFDYVVQISVTHILHGDRAVNGRNDHHVVCAIDTGIRKLWREHRLEEHDEAASKIGGCRHLEIEVGGDDHLRQRIVKIIGLVIVCFAHGKPDPMEIDSLYEVLEQGKNLHDLRGIWGHLGQVDGG